MSAPDDKFFHSYESLRESEAIPTSRIVNYFDNFVLKPYWASYYDENYIEDVIPKLQLQLMVSILKRLLMFSDYKSLSPEQKSKIQESLELLFFENANMSQSEISLMKKYCNSETNLLEFGSGFSTIHHAKKCKSVVSFEFDAIWYTRVITLLYMFQLEEKVEYVYYPENMEADFIQAFHLQDQNKKFDVVSIDGGRRLEIAKEILPCLSDESIVIFSDFWREKRHNEQNYSQVFEWYDVVESSKKGNTFIVLRKKKGV